MDDRERMLGVKVTSFVVSDDNYSATLKGIKLDKEVEFHLETEADCCSDTWIESVVEESALVGYTILKVENLELADAANNFEHSSLKDKLEEEMAFYGLAITTERGKCVIDYRNSSNGYYGGSLEITQTI